jgi:hypothetical protein
VELVALKAAIEQMTQEYAFSERRACGLVMVAVSTYRYEASRCDEPLRTKLVEWRGRSGGSGINDCMYYCGDVESE